jgi:hypothetical protein
MGNGTVCGEVFLGVERKTGRNELEDRGSVCLPLAGFVQLA